MADESARLEKRGAALRTRLGSRRRQSGLDSKNRDPGRLRHVLSTFRYIRSTYREAVQRHRTAVIRRYESGLLSFDSLDFVSSELALATTSREADC